MDEFFYTVDENGFLTDIIFSNKEKEFYFKLKFKLKRNQYYLLKTLEKINLLVYQTPDNHLIIDHNNKNKKGFVFIKQFKLSTLLKEKEYMLEHPINYYYFGYQE
jgi:hypothetical protein